MPTWVHIFSSEEFIICMICILIENFTYMTLSVIGCIGHHLLIYLIAWYGNTTLCLRAYVLLGNSILADIGYIVLGVCLPFASWIKLLESNSSFLLSCTSCWCYWWIVCPVKHLVIAKQTSSCLKLRIIVLCGLIIWVCTFLANCNMHKCICLLSEKQSRADWCK